MDPNTSDLDRAARVSAEHQRAHEAEMERRIQALKKLEAEKVRALNQAKKRQKKGLGHRRAPIVRDRHAERQVLAAAAVEEMQSRKTFKVWEIQKRPKTSAEYRQLLNWLERQGLIERDRTNGTATSHSIRSRTQPVPA